MKKIEAQTLAPIKSKLIIEYIIQILSDSNIINSNINFVNKKIDNQHMCIVDIYVPNKNFERHLNLEITSDHSLVLYGQVLNDLLDNFLESDNIGISKYYCIESMFQESFSGIDVVNLNGSKIKINFNTTQPDFMTLASEYNRRYNEFEEQSKKHI